MVEPDFVRRVRQEREDLEMRITKLRQFIGSDKFTELSVAHRALLRDQLAAMDNYWRVLVIRLELLDKEVSNGR